MRLVIPVAAAVLVAASVSSSLWAAEENVPTIVICSAAGRCESHRPTESLQVPEDAAFAWIWSSKSLPRRLSAKEIPGAVSNLESDPGSAVSIRTSPLLKNEQLTVRTAPAAMWREVPEALLPQVAGAETLSLPLRQGEPWRIRLTSATRTSLWTDVETSPAVVPLIERKPRELVVLDSEGERLANAHVSVLAAGGGGSGRSESIARFETDQRGQFTLPDAAGSRRVGLIVSHPRHAPQWISGSIEELPSPIRLEAGCVLTGRVARREGDDLVPVANARVSVDAWIGGSTAVFAKNVQTSADGMFRIESVPRGKTLIAVVRESFALWRESADLVADRELEVVLQPEARTTVKVVDGDGVAIERASIRNAAEWIRADQSGRVLLRGLSPDRPTKLVASAPGFLVQEVVLTPPLENEMVITLQRGVTIRGIGLTEEGLAPREGKVTARFGRADRTRSLEADGRFELTVPPGEKVELSVSSASALDTHRTIEPAAAGASIDLGRIVLRSGSVVRGRVLSAADSTPIPMARIWAVKPSDDGLVAAFVRGNVVQTSSADDGTFELRGLESGPLLLRVDAPGFARLYRETGSGPAHQAADVGELRMQPGSLVTVLAGGEGERSAELDLRGGGFPGDLLTVRVIDGKAEFRHIATGSYRVRVRTEHRIECETEVRVRAGEDARVECAATPMRVHGRVFVGSQPARRGSLIWTSPDGEGVHAIILNRDSPGGLRQQQAFGAPSASVTIDVADDGSFASEALRPGPWNVRLVDDDGNSVSSVAITVPREEVFACTLRYEGGLVAGTVRDADGRPHAGATITDLRNGARTRSRGDGSFALMGLAPGTARLLATSGELRSEIVQVPIDDSRGPGAELRLRAGNRSHTEIRVQTRDGLPAAGAFVFVETASRRAAILTADHSGVAIFRHEAAEAQPIRVAAVAGGDWFLGEWLAPDATGDSISIRVPRSGSIVIRGAGTDVRLLTVSGWDVTAMVRFLGVPALPEAGSLFIRGLPAGAYALEADGRSRSVAVTAEHVTDIDLR